MKIISYVIARDKGFAPNPFHGFLTLATCKPRIRSSRSTEKGDMLVGTGSKKTVGTDKLVYAAIISEIVSIEEYGSSKRFDMKKPRTKGEWYDELGDNIYQKINGQWKQRKNPSYREQEDMDRDLGGKNVLICKEFLYFGSLAKAIPDEISAIINKGSNCKHIKDQNLVNKFKTWLCELKKTEKQGKPYDLSQTSCSAPGKQSCTKPRTC